MAAEEIIFKVGVDTGNTVKDLNSVETELKQVDSAAQSIGTDAAKRFEELNKKVASGTMTIRESAKAVKEYQTIALQAGRETPIGQAAIQAAGDLTDKIGDLRNEIKNAGTDGANMQAALQLGSGIAAGYGAMQGTMALLGVESDKLQETFVKLQAVQSILAGIEQIRAILEKESFLMMKARTIATKAQTAAEVIYAAAVGTTTGAMKALRLAMLAIPIVAIIAGIVALVAVVQQLTKANENAAEMNDAVTKSYDRQQAAFERASAMRTRAINNEIELAKARGANDEELHQLELKRINEGESQRRKAADMEKKAIEGKKIAFAKALLEQNDDLAKQIKDEIKQHQKKYRDLKDLDGQYKVDLKKQQLEFDKAQKDEAEKNEKEKADAQQKAAEAARKKREEAARKQLEQDRLLQDLLVANIKDTNQRAIAELGLKQQRERDELIKNYGKNTTLLKELETKQANEMLALIDEQDKAYKEQQDQKALEADKSRKDAIERENLDRKSALEAKLIALEDDFQAEHELKKELAALEMEQALMNTDLTEGEKTKIIEEYNKKIRDIDKATADNKKKLDQESLDRTIKITEDALGSLQNLSDTFFSIKMANVEKGSKEEEKLARKQFQVNKALQLSGAIIDAGKAITASLAQSPIAIGPVPNPVGIASLAFAATTAAANIAKIAATKFESTSGSGSGSVQAPSLNAGGETAPDVPTPSTLTDGLPGSGSGQGKATKVYVLDSDITAQQTMSKKIDTLSTWGG